jgi:hypothetical protein
MTFERLHRAAEAQARLPSSFFTGEPALLELLRQHVEVIFNLLSGIVVELPRDEEPFDLADERAQGSPH